MDKELKKVLVTGGNGGLGRAVTEYFANNGVFVYCCDIKKGEEYKNVKQVYMDVTSEDSVLRAFEEIKGETDRLDAIINFAGIYVMDSLVEIDEKDIKRIFDVNFFGAYRVNKAFLPLIIGGGRILITTSELAPLDPLPFTGLYGITKTTLDKYADSLRMELALLKIPVVVIRPGAFKTNLLDDSTKSLEKLCAKTKLYNYNANKFREIVNKTESKALEANILAKLVYKAAFIKRPKYVYTKNANKMLKLLSFLPKNWQVKIITKMIKK